MLCAANVHIGPLGQTFWAVLDRESGEIIENTHTLLPAERGEVWTERGGGFDPWDLGTSGKGIRTRIDSKGTTARLRFRDPDEWVETICPTGEGSGDGGYVWTRKRPSTIELRMELADGRHIEDELRGIEDESAGYHPRQHRLELVGRGRHRRRRPRRRLEPGRGRQRPGGAQRAGDLDRRGSTPRARSRRLRGPRSGRLRRRLPPGFQGGGRTQRRPEHVPRQVEVPTALRHVQRFTGGDRAGRRHRRNGVPRGNLVTTRCPARHPQIGGGRYVISRMAGELQIADHCGHQSAVQLAR